MLTKESIALGPNGAPQGDGGGCLEAGTPPNSLPLSQGSLQS